MFLNLREIINVPGQSVPFDFSLDPDGLDFPSVEEVRSAPHAVGSVVNEAGVLHVTGEITTDLVCACDRCGVLFSRKKQTPIHAILVEEDDGENPDLFLLEGDGADLSEIVLTDYVLDMESKFLCSPDCKGLCPECGKNLNEGPCGCGKKLDPRFAVLEQLLDK